MWRSDTQMERRIATLQLLQTADLDGASETQLRRRRGRGGVVVLVCVF